MANQPHGKPSTAGRPVRIELDHPRYLSERRYRREVVLGARRQMRKRGLYLIRDRHADDGSCCRQEPLEVTGRHLTAQLRQDGHDSHAWLAPGWVQTPPEGMEAGAVSRYAVTRLHAMDFLARARAGRPNTFCEHIRTAIGAQPRVFGWVTDPECRITCFECALAFAAHIRDTAEDHTCDNCRRQVATIRGGAMEVPPIASGGPPLALLCGLCDECFEADVLHPVEEVEA